MAKEVDTKVVEMVFDNKDFEKGVKETKQSISDLKGSIKSLSDAADGSESVEKVNKVVVDKMSVLASAVNATVTRITNDIFDGINKITSKFNELTIAPISQGFGKYESQVESVQIIMNATGKSIDEVTEQLEKLMWYTDETSYSYADMASNIGKFASAGVDLDDAMTAMMGIANWAGVSGANVQQASRAMYNLSQAIGSGSLQLRDWMSIENANMATKEFKQTIIDVAKELGVLDKDTEITAENFRDSLKDKWVTGEVLTEALKRYGNYTEDLYKLHLQGADNIVDAQEEYSKVFDELADTLLETYEKYGKASDEFNKILQDNSISMQTAMDIVSKKQAQVFNTNLDKIAKKLKETSDKYGKESKEFAKMAEKYGYSIKDACKMVEEGVESFKMAEVSLGEKSFKAAQEAKTFKDAWEATIDAVSTQWLRFWDALFGNYEEAKSMWTYFTNEVLWPTFAGPIDQLATMAEYVKELGGRTNILDGLRKAWDALNDVIAAVNRGIRKVWPAFNGIKQVAAYVYGVTVRFKEWAESIDTSNERLSKVTEMSRNLFTILKAIAELIVNIGLNALRVLNAILGPLEMIFDIFKSLLEAADGIAELSKILQKVITKITTYVVLAITYIKKVIVSGGKLILTTVLVVISLIVSALSHINFRGIFNVIANVLAAVLLIITDIGIAIYHVLSNTFNGIKSLVTGIANFISSLVTSEDKMQTMYEWFRQMDFYGGMLKVIFDSLLKTFEVLSIVIDYFLKGLGKFFTSIDMWKASFITLVILLISNATGVAVIVGGLFGKIIDVIKTLFSPLGPLKAILKAFLTSISDAVNDLLSIIDVAKLEAVGHLMLMYATSVVVLSFAAMELSRIDPNVFWEAIKAVGALMAMMFAFAALTKALQVWEAKKLAAELKDIPDELQGTVKSLVDIAALFIGMYGVINSLKGLVTVLGDVWTAVNGDPWAFYIILSGVAVLIAGMFAGILLFTKSLKTANEATQNETNKFSLELKSISGNMVDIGLALIGIAAALAVLTFVEPDNLKQAAIIMGAFAAYFIIMLGIMKAVAKSMSKFDTKNAKDNPGINTTSMETYINAMAMGLKSLSIAFISMAASMLWFSRMDPTRLNHAIVAFSIVALAAIGMIGVFGYFLSQISSTYSSSEVGDKAFDGKLSGLFKANASGHENIDKTVDATGVMVEHIEALGNAIAKIMRTMSLIAISLVPLAAMKPESIQAVGKTIAEIMLVMIAALGGILGVLRLFNKDNTEYDHLHTTMGVIVDETGAAADATRDLHHKASGLNGEDIKEIGQGFFFFGLAIALVAQALVPLAIIEAADRWVNQAYDNIADATGLYERQMHNTTVLQEAFSLLMVTILVVTGMFAFMLVLVKNTLSTTKKGIEENGADTKIDEETIEEGTIDPDVLKSLGNALLKIGATIAMLMGIMAIIGGLEFIPGMADRLRHGLILISITMGLLIALIYVLFKSARNFIKETHNATEDNEEMSEVDTGAIEALGDLVIQIGKMLAIVAGAIIAMALLSVFTDTAKLITAGASINLAIGLLTVLIGVMFSQLGKLCGGTDIDKIQEIPNILESLGKAMVLIGAAIGIISLGVMAILLATKNNSTALPVLFISLIGMGLLMAEIGFGLKMLFDAIKDVENGDKWLLTIAGSVLMISAAMLVLSFAFQQMQKLGSDILPMIGYFFVIMLVFWTYTFTLLQALKAMQESGNHDWKVLLAIAGQVVLFSTALLIMVPAITMLMEAVDRFGGISLGAAIAAILGLLILMATVSIVMMAAAKQFSPTTDGAIAIISLGASMILMAAAVVILAGALKILEGIDFGSIVKGLFAIAVVFVEFIGTTILLAGVLKTVGAGVVLPIFGLGLAFMAFGAALWLTAIAFRTFADTLRDITNDGTIRELAAVLQEYPDALEGIITALGVAFGGILLKSLVTFIVGSAGIQILKDGIKTIFSRLATWLAANVPALLGNPIGLGIVAGIVAVLSIASLADFLKEWAETGDSDNFFFQQGKKSADNYAKGYKASLKGNGLFTGFIFQGMSEDPNAVFTVEEHEKFLGQELEERKKFYRDLYVKAYDVYTHDEKDKSAVNEWKHYVQTATDEEYALMESVREELTNPTSMLQGQRHANLSYVVEQKTKYQEEQNSWNKLNAEKEKKLAMENGRKIREAQKEERRKAAEEAALEERVRLQQEVDERIRAENDVHMSASNNAEDLARQRTAYQEAEAARAYTIAENKYSGAVRVATVEAEAAANKAKSDEEVIVRQDDAAARATEIAEKNIKEAEEQKNVVNDIGDAVDDVLTVEGLRATEIENQNNLLRDQLSLEKLISVTKSGDFTSLTSFLGADNTKDTAVKALKDRLGGFLKANSGSILAKLGISNPVVDQYIEMIKNGVDPIKGAMDLLGDEKTKDSFKQFWSGLKHVIGFNPEAILEFDINDIPGSLKKIINIDTDKGKELIKQFFGLTSDEEVSVETLTSKLMSFIDEGDLFGKMTGNFRLPTYETPDYSKVINGEELGQMNADAYTKGFTDNFDYNSLITPTTEQVDQAKQEAEQRAQIIADAEAKAYNTAYEAALHAYDKKDDKTPAGLKAAEETIENIHGSAEVINGYNMYYYHAAKAWDSKLKDLKRDLLDKDGNFKAGVTDTQKEDYEEAQRKTEEYKQLLEKSQETIEKKNEELKEAKELKEYYKNPEKIYKEIEKAEQEQELLTNRLLENDYNIFDEDLLGDLEEIGQKLDKLYGIQKQIEGDIPQEGDDTENTPLDFESETVKEARKALDKDYDDLDKTLNDANMWLGYFNSKETLSAKDKEEMEYWTGVKKQVEAEMKANREQKKALTSKNYDNLVAEKARIEEEEEYYKDMLKSGVWINDQQGHAIDPAERLRQLAADKQRVEQQIENTKSIVNAAEEEISAVDQEITAMNGLTTSTNSLNTAFGTDSTGLLGSTNSLTSSFSELEKSLPTDLSQYTDSTALNSVLGTDTTGLLGSTNELTTAFGTDSTGLLDSTNSLTSSFSDYSNAMQQYTSQIPTDVDAQNAWASTKSASYTPVTSGTKDAATTAATTTAAATTQLNNTTTQNATTVATYMGDITGKLEALNGKVNAVLLKMDTVIANQTITHTGLANAADAICNGGVNTNIINYSKVVNKMAKDVDKILGRSAMASSRGN